MFWLLLSIAVAQDDCPPIGESVERAWAQYNDAEVDAAKVILQEAYADLPCQTEVVTTASLLDLYRLDALVSITQADEKGAVYATLRAVAAKHEGGRPPESYGPRLAELYDTWSQRMGGALVSVTVDGGGVVYVDGREVTASGSLQVAEGEHLVQIEGDGDLTSEVVDLADDHEVATGVPLPAGQAELPGYAAPPPAPVPAPEPVEPAPVPQPSVASGRRRPIWAFAGAALAGGGAVFALSSAYVSETNFLSDPYTGLGSQRVDVITQDAAAIRVAYGVGYGLAGVSAGLLTVGLIGLPARSVSAPPGVRIQGRW